VLNSINFIL